MENIYWKKRVGIDLYRSRRLLISDKRSFSSFDWLRFADFLLVNCCCSIKCFSERRCNASNARFWPCNARSYSQRKGDESKIRIQFFLLVLFVTLNSFPFQHHLFHHRTRIKSNNQNKKSRKIFIYSRLLIFPRNCITFQTTDKWIIIRIIISSCLFIIRWIDYRRNGWCCCLRNDKPYFTFNTRSNRWLNITSKG